VVSSKSLLDGVSFLIDIDTAIRADATRKGVPVNTLEPTISIDGFGQRWKGWQGRKGHAWWLILARATLMRPFIGVMLHEALSHFTPLLQGSRPMDLQTLLSVAAMVPFDKGIFIWTLSRTDNGLDAQAEQEAAQGRGKITPTGTADPSGISVEGESGREARRSQEAHDSIQGSFGMKIIRGLSAEQNGGASINTIEHFDHPAFACLLDQQERWLHL